VSHVCDIFFPQMLTSDQALEDGEDIQELAERARDKKDRRAQNKLLKEGSARNTPASDVIDGRGRKPKKGKAKANDYDGAGSKRKRGMKSMSATPEIDDDDDDHDIVSTHSTHKDGVTQSIPETETTQDQG
jgi:hypothetical protein